MRHALALAARAGRRVRCRGGARGGRRERDRGRRQSDGAGGDATEHAEIRVLRAAARRLGDGGSMG